MRRLLDIMYRLDESQAEKLSEAAVIDFENRMVVHLGRHFSEQCEALGEHGVREAIRFGIARSSHYGIVNERDVCKYIDLMFAFGREFDTDEDLPWASRILKDKDPRYHGGTLKIERLYETALTQVHNAAGVDGSR
jgi:hypothetical protein